MKTYIVTVQIAVLADDNTSLDDTVYNTLEDKKGILDWSYMDEEIIEKEINVSEYEEGEAFC